MIIIIKIIKIIKCISELFKKTTKGQKGFTLVEVVMAMFILSAGMVIVMGTFAESNKHIFFLNQSDEALNLNKSLNAKISEKLRLISTEDFANINTSGVFINLDDAIEGKEEDENKELKPLLDQLEELITDEDNPEYSLRDNFSRKIKIENAEIKDSDVGVDFISNIKKVTTRVYSEIKRHPVDSTSARYVELTSNINRRKLTPIEWEVSGNVSIPSRTLIRVTLIETGQTSILRNDTDTPLTETTENFTFDVLSNHKGETFNLKLEKEKMDEPKEPNKNIHSKITLKPKTTKQFLNDEEGIEERKIILGRTVNEKGQEFKILNESGIYQEITDVGGWVFTSGNFKDTTISDEFNDGNGGTKQIIDFERKLEQGYEISFPIQFSQEIGIDIRVNDNITSAGSGELIEPEPNEIINKRLQGDNDRPFNMELTPRDKREERGSDSYNNSDYQGPDEIDDFKSGDKDGWSISHIGTWRFRVTGYSVEEDYESAKLLFNLDNTAPRIEVNYNDSFGAKFRRLEPDDPSNDNPNNKEMGYDIPLKAKDDDGPYNSGMQNLYYNLTQDVYGFNKSQINNVIENFGTNTGNWIRIENESGNYNQSIEDKVQIRREVFPESRIIFKSKNDENQDEKEVVRGYDFDKKFYLHVIAEDMAHKDMDDLDDEFNNFNPPQKGNWTYNVYGPYIISPNLTAVRDLFRN